MKYLISVAAAAVLGLSACSPKDETARESHQAAKSDDITIVNALIRPPFPGRDTAASYFTIVNRGKDNALVAVSSPLSDQVELHNHINDNGVMKMRRVEDGVSVGSGETLEFKPGSYHVMLFKVKIKETQKTAPLTLTFKNGEIVTLETPIEGRGDGKGSHSSH